MMVIYLALGYLSVITTKSSSYSKTRPSGFAAAFSMYRPRPLRGSHGLETAAFLGVSGGRDVDLGFFACDMSSVTVW